ncbi:sterile alpha motif domain-containing protein 13 isoform X2 [Notechis scutatus]|uniref:Sterile alpha motif domain-containing protein 13 isoform X2 n=1 Tax=Notechis scutatus TaxID=8663 RepID=A0A6J1V322_9SAUR|nr:sterile alpha motif domain-containing protein 13 isoform X2 [Notechis scutatus]
MYVYMRKVPDVKDPTDISMLSIDMENKENGSLDKENLVENGRPPDPADWAVTDVVNYFRTVGFEEQANAFQEQDLSFMDNLGTVGELGVFGQKFIGN